MKLLIQSLLTVLVFTVLTGILFPFAITAIAQTAFPKQANGSLIEKDGKVVGSALIGQSFSGVRYFHPRPSAAGGGYDASASGGTNLGPTNAKLVNGIPDDPKTKDVDESFAGFPQLAAQYRRENGLKSTDKIPADAITRSASGLDPDISIANAKLQAPRVAAARNLALSEVYSMIKQHTDGRFIGIYGEPRVNVLKLNLALDELSKR